MRSKRALPAVGMLAALLLAACNEGTTTPDVADEAGGDAADAPVDVAADGDADGAGEDGGEADVPSEDVGEDAADVPSDVVEDVADVPSDAPSDVGEDVADAPSDVEDGTDEGGGDVAPPACPEDMVEWADFCIDRYEASRSDADAASAGTDESVATSRSGVIPWAVNPFDATALAAFEAACAAAGKRLCRAEEWGSACGGSGGLAYVYGAAFDREVCNCVDTFCDDHCATEGIPPGDCDTAADCGYRYMCFRLLPTGSMPGCTNEAGTFDINGNVWEIVRSTTDTRGYEIRGGAFNCAMASARVGCTFNAAWTSLFAGFRCCKDR